MFITGIIYSSTTILFYLIWFLWFPVDFNYIYDYTVLCDCIIAVGCLLMDTSKSDKLLNYALAVCSLMSLALRYVNTDCTGCSTMCTDIDTCLYSSCCSLRSYTNLIINIVPIATAGIRTISIQKMPKNV